MICFGFGNRFITALTYRIQAWLLNPGGTFGDIISLAGKGLSKGPSFIPEEQIIQVPEEFEHQPGKTEEVTRYGGMQCRVAFRSRGLPQPAAGVGSGENDNLEKSLNGLYFLLYLDKVPIFLKELYAQITELLLSTDQPHRQERLVVLVGSFPRVKIF
ncbi:unnamed protein product [Cladocopium goreaui]|uniref:Uncharacterized protein n=1 Tax=Cladocopium goreaui TaxID=2562237 RepID=A0A9P1CKP3_9DINO|nr:unnamed protein product [Cladocopium goreaui]